MDTRQRRLVTGAAVLVALALAVPLAQWSATGQPLRPPAPGVMEGSIARLDVVSRSPRMGVDLGHGQVVDLALDPKETVILMGGQPATVDQLAVGRQVKTYYVQRNGQSVATSVVVKPPVLSFAPTPSSATTPVTPEPITR